MASAFLLTEINDTHQHMPLLDLPFSSHRPFFLLFLFSSSRFQNTLHSCRLRNLSNKFSRSWPAVDCRSAHLTRSASSMYCAVVLKFGQHSNALYTLPQSLTRFIYGPNIARLAECAKCKHFLFRCNRHLFYLVLSRVEQLWQKCMNVSFGRAIPRDQLSSTRNHSFDMRNDINKTFISSIHCGEAWVIWVIHRMHSVSVCFSANGNLNGWKNENGKQHEAPYISSINVVQCMWRSLLTESARTHTADTVTTVIITI